jgi:hypothetical protein
MQEMATRLIIEVEGGAVSGLTSDSPDLEVIVVDRDVEATPEEELDEIGDGFARVREWEIYGPPPAGDVSVFDIMWATRKNAAEHQIAVC